MHGIRIMSIANILGYRARRDKSEFNEWSLYREDFIWVRLQWTPFSSQYGEARYIKGSLYRASTVIRNSFVILSMGIEILLQNTS